MRRTVSLRVLHGHKLSVSFHVICLIWIFFSIFTLRKLFFQFLYSGRRFLTYTLVIFFVRHFILGIISILCCYLRFFFPIFWSYYIDFLFLDFLGCFWRVWWRTWWILHLIYVFLFMFRGSFFCNIFFLLLGGIFFSESGL